MLSSSRLLRRNDAFSHSPVHHALDEFNFIEVVGEADIDCACLIEYTHLFAAELQLKTREIVFQLLDAARADNRDYGNLARLQPCQGDLSHRQTNLLAYF